MVMGEMSLVLNLLQKGGTDLFLTSLGLNEG